jgi:rhodanese-related sulfurtransferase
MRHNRNEFGAPEPSETATAMEDTLRFHTDAWDLSVDLKAGRAAIVIDARCRDASIAGHIPSVVSFPHREMNSETTARLDRGKVYVVYGEGIGGNASTKGADKRARLGFRAKESLGGLDWWRRDVIR